MRGNREGMALMLVIIVMMVAATVATGAAVIGANSWVMAQHEERQSILQAAADAGLEEARARINGNRSLLPDSNYVALENNIQVTDASGNAIPGVRRWVYVGPSGATTGQYGLFASVVAVTMDAGGEKVIRRAEIIQESFAKYGYFTNDEGSMQYGDGDDYFGPVHSNDDMIIHSTGASFMGPVTTTRAAIAGTSYATFTPAAAPPTGYQTSAAHIGFPNSGPLTTLRNYATTGGLALTSSAVGAEDEATMRLFFVAIDLNGDGDKTDDDEGFVRIYNCNSATWSCASWVTAHIPYGQSDWRWSRNCGHFNASQHGTSTNFVDAASHGSEWYDALTIHGTRRCFLGGADELWDGAFVANDGTGSWLPWPGTVDPRLVALSRPDRNYLWPLSRGNAPNYKGVIHVNGKVAISGELRGRVTVAASSNIVIVDDMRYSVNPASGVCKDVLGLFSGNDIVIADNGINSPTQVTGAAPYITYDETRDEFLDAVVLALSSFETHDLGDGSTTAEPCGTITWGRGCLYLNGGIIEGVHGIVGGLGYGYLKRLAYDGCAANNPPPYFPATGHFVRTRVFEIDPTGFTIAGYFATLKPN
jgi:hypothetical protein